MQAGLLSPMISAAFTNAPVRVYWPTPFPLTTNKFDPAMAMPYGVLNPVTREALIVQGSECARCAWKPSRGRLLTSELRPRDPQPVSIISSETPASFVMIGIFFSVLVGRIARLNVFIPAPAKSTPARIELYPREFVFCPYRGLRGKGPRIVERRYCHVHPFRTDFVLDKQRRATTRGERAQSICI